MKAPFVLFTLLLSATKHMEYTKSSLDGITRTVSRVGGGAALLALAAGCLLGPDFERPETPELPDAFRGAERPAEGALPASGSPEAVDAPALRDTTLPEGGEARDGDTPRRFAPPPSERGAEQEMENGERKTFSAYWAERDPLLAELLAEAASTNLTLLQARSRLAQSRASLAQSRASLWPTLGVSASANASKTYDPDDSSESYRAGADTGWELDLFGRNRRLAEASEAELEAAGYTVADVLLSLQAEVVADYSALRLAQESLDIAKANLEADERNAEIARAKGESGFTTGADIAAAEAGIATARATIPARDAAVSSAARAIELLLARAPFSMEERLAAPAPVPEAPEVPSIAPADVLARRPDVRRAEAAFHAAVARIGAARAARFPSINLAASATITADSLSNWADGLKSLGIGPSVSLPLFQGGRLRAAERQAREAAEEARLGYVAAVLGAVHEAQDLWTRLASERARGADLAEAVRRDEEALDAARQLYQAGRSDYTAVTVRQTALLSARLALAQHRADLATLTASLVKALGGL